MRCLLSAFTIIALLAATGHAQAATLSKLPDILSNAHQDITTDTLNQSLLNLMHQRDRVHHAEDDLNALAPAAGSSSDKSEATPDSEPDQTGSAARLSTK